MEKLRVGVIGAGKISDIHLEAWSKNSKVKLVSICDMNLDRAKAQATKYKIENVFSSMQELFEYDNIDAVDIVLPNYLHAPTILESLKRNKQVICEKPLAMSKKELAMIEEYSKKSKCSVHLKQYLRYSAVHKAAAELIAKGAIGDVYLAIGKFSARFSQLLTDKQNWRANAEFSGGGVLMEIGVHCIDYFNSVLGEPKSVSGSMQGEPVETVSETIVKYGKSAAVIICDWTSPSQNNWWSKQFYGAKGHINIIDEKKDNVRLEVFDENGAMKLTEEKNWWREANIAAINGIAERILNNTPPLASVKEAKASLAVIRGAYASDKEGKEVSI